MFLQHAMEEINTSPALTVITCGINPDPADPANHSPNKHFKNGNLIAIEKPRLLNMQITDPINISNHTDHPCGGRKEASSSKTSIGNKQSN